MLRVKFVSTGMRLGFGKILENFMLQLTLILYNTAGSSYKMII